MSGGRELTASITVASTQRTRQAFPQVPPPSSAAAPWQFCCVASHSHLTILNDGELRKGPLPLHKGFSDFVTPKSSTLPFPAGKSRHVRKVWGRASLLPGLASSLYLRMGHRQQAFHKHTHRSSSLIYVSVSMYQKKGRVRQERFETSGPHICDWPGRNLDRAPLFLGKHQLM